MRKVLYGDDKSPYSLVINMEDDLSEIRDLARLFNDPAHLVEDTRDALMIQRVMCLITAAAERLEERRGKIFSALHSSPAARKGRKSR